MEECTFSITSERVQCCRGCQVTIVEALEMPTVAVDGSSETDVCVSTMVVLKLSEFLLGPKNTFLNLCTFSLVVHLCSAERRAVRQTRVPVLPSEQE